MNIRPPAFGSLHMFQYTPQYMDSSYYQHARVEHGPLGDEFTIDQVHADTFRCMDCVTEHMSEIADLSKQLDADHDISKETLKEELAQIALSLKLPPHIQDLYFQLLEKGTYQFLPRDGIGQSYTAARFILPIRKLTSA